MPKKKKSKPKRMTEISTVGVDMKKLVIANEIMEKEFKKLNGGKDNDIYNV